MLLKIFVVTSASHRGSVPSDKSAHHSPAEYSDILLQPHLDQQEVTSATELIVHGLPTKIPAFPSVNCVMASHAPVAAAYLENPAIFMPFGHTGQCLLYFPR